MSLPAADYAQQFIRLCDVWKRLGLYNKATKGLANIVDRCSKKEQVSRYLDVALQHLGKVQYTMGQIECALRSFQKALERRLKKKDQDLINSFQTAIEACLKTLALRKSESQP